MNPLTVRRYEFGPMYWIADLINKLLLVGILIVLIVIAVQLNTDADKLIKAMRALGEVVGVVGPCLTQEFCPQI